MTKEKFCKFIREYEVCDKKEMRLNEAIEEYCGEPVQIFSSSLTLILEILETVMNDNDGLIVSFIYDADYGHIAEPVYEVNGKQYRIDSPEVLYDVLTGNA